MGSHPKVIAWMRMGTFRWGGLPRGKSGRLTGSQKGQEGTWAKKRGVGDLGASWREMGGDFGACMEEIREIPPCWRGTFYCAVGGTESVLGELG